MPNKVNGDPLLSLSLNSVHYDKINEYISLIEFFLPRTPPCYTEVFGVLLLQNQEDTYF